MTPPPGNVRPDGRGGLRVVREGIEHLITARDHRPQRPAALQPEHDRRGGPMKPPRTLSVSAALRPVCQAAVAQRLKDRKQQKVIDV